MVLVAACAHVLSNSDLIAMGILLITVIGMPVGFSYLCRSCGLSRKLLTASLAPLVLCSLVCAALFPSKYFCSFQIRMRLHCCKFCLWLRAGGCVVYSSFRCSSQAPHGSYFSLKRQPRNTNLAKSLHRTCTRVFVTHCREQRANSRGTCNSVGTVTGPVHVSWDDFKKYVTRITAPKCSRCGSF